MTGREKIREKSENMILIDGEELTRLMIEYGVGVSTSAVYEIKKIDSDYFEEELF